MELTKATLTLVNENGEPVDEKGRPVKNNPAAAFQVEATFNPQQLDVSYRAFGSNSPQANSEKSESGSDSANARSNQSTGYRSTLTTTLFFDTSDSGDDVRRKTLDIAKMLQRRENGQSSGGNKSKAPRVRFQWGSFVYYGRITSLNETLDYFSQGGVPLRATLRVDMVSDQPDKIGAGLGIGAGVGVRASAGAAVGTRELTATQSGETVQDVAARAGRDWKEVASANGIDNPRQVQPGTVIDTQARGNR